MTDVEANRWGTDYDVFDPRYVADPFPIWDELRESCPVAHTERLGGSWLPTRYGDVTAVAHDVEHFSSLDVGVVPLLEDDERLLPVGLPPIAADPPEHTWSRRLLLPWFSHRRVAEYEVSTRQICRGLVDDLLASGRGDAAVDYAQQIPARVISLILGVPPELSDTFTGWVRDVLEFANVPERREAGRAGILGFITEQMERRRNEPGDDLISALLQSEVDGQPVPDEYIMGIIGLTLIAGVDTTWSAIGASLWHLATHPADRQRLVGEPELLPVAIEELLRAYAPVTMARVANEGAEIAGCPVNAGDRVLLSFSAANRDPEAFPDADEVVIDRMQNRHVAFGVGIHRCAGSNLARMELRVALEEWLARIPEFTLQEGADVTWAGGQVRGPRSIPVAFT